VGPRAGLNAVAKRKIFAGNRKLNRTLTELPGSQILQQYLETGHDLLPYPYFSSFMIRESELKLLYNWWFVYRQSVLLDDKPLETHDTVILFSS
jgi:hypothetical protein